MARRTTSDDAARAREFLAAARLMRSEYLNTVALGLITPLDLIEAACTPDGKPLRQIGLRDLLIAQPRVGRSTSRAFLSAVAERLDLDDDLETKDVSWLVDPRAGGRRLLAWLDASTPKSIPWPGFPFTPRPDSTSQRVTTKESVTTDA